jgi:hypothetical protein
MSAKLSTTQSFLRRNAPERYFAVIGIAGAVYPLLADLLASVWSGRFGFDVDDVLGLACFAPFGALLAVVGSIAALFLGMGIHLALRLWIDNVRFFSFSSGLLGFFALIPLLMSGVDYTGLLPWSRGAMYFVVGPGLITPLFQLAGGWNEWRVSGPPAARRPWRFRLKELLAVTFGVAVLLGLLKLIQGSMSWIVAWTSAWIVYQWLTMWLVLRFLGWLYRQEAGLGGGEGDDGGMRG